jgi:hypothetical protein
MTDPTSQFRFVPLPDETRAVRQEISAFLAANLAHFTALDRAHSWMGFDAAFSAKLGERGWIGMAMPQRYGGADAGIFARYVVMEELLAAGAPVGAHLIADRQSGPLILRYGTEEQRQKILPGICRGKIFVCIGMSEPNSGSDLASITSRARRDGNDWILDGRKLWTTNAHRAHYMIALVRTSGTHADRQTGLSQFLIDLSSPGVTIRPVRDLTGGEHFNEVFLDGVRLDGDCLIGQEGHGWEQVTAELAFERSGPERFLSSIALFKSLIATVGTDPDPIQASTIGRLTARLAVLRSMSLAVTEQLARGENPAWAAAVVKDLGTAFEQDLPEAARLALDIEPRITGGSEYANVLAFLTQMAPSFSLRGGTREILRGIIARGLGVR